MLERAAPPAPLDDRAPSFPEVAAIVSEQERRGADRRNWANIYVFWVALCDTVFAALALTLLAQGTALATELAPYWIAVAVAGWPVIIAILGGYNRDEVGVGTRDIGAVLRGVVYLIAAGAVVMATGLAQGFVALLVVAAPGMAVLALLTRLVARKAVHHLQCSGRLLRDVAVVGSLSSARHLIRILEREPYCGLRPVGVCVPMADADEAHRQGFDVLGDIEDAATAAALVGCDGIAVTAGQSPEFLRKLAWSLEGSDLDLLVHPGLVEISGPRMHLRPYVGLPLLHVERPHFTGWRRAVKRATDVALTSIVLLLAAPFMLVVAAMIKLGDRGPVFFTQTRVGQDGKTFKVFKFRSMVVDAEARMRELQQRNEVDGGVLFKLKDDPRITRVGKFLRKYSMDELPQLFNVLRGDMSLVGPRPPLPTEVDEYAEDVHRRLLVKPGLTGLWQVSGRSLLSWEESVRLDLRYVENWCLSMDLLLLWKTVWAVMAKRGAF